MPEPGDVQAAFCNTLVDEWVRAGVHDAVVAPGSRSTPVVLALAADPRVRSHVVLDERCAGFVALGIALATGRPGVVVTTSGTAAAEVHPAVIEASHAGVPLLVVTADRPFELHDVGAPQTVEQEGLFGTTVRFEASPGVPDESAAAGWRSLAARCAAMTTGGPAGPGPVHLNLAFRDPLLGTPVGVPAGRAGDAPWHGRSAGIAGSGSGGPGFAWPGLGAFPGRRGLVVAGDGIGDPVAVVEACRRLGWPLLADPRSGCRLPAEPVVAAADALLRVPEVARWVPEVVVRLGAPWASKVLSQWLATLGPGVAQVLVDPWGRWWDPERAATEVVAAEPSVLMEALAGEAIAPADPGWLGQWLAAERAAQGVFDRELTADLSEPAVARWVVSALAADGLLVVASSMPVRDVEWYSAPRHGARVLANRGANGIDGVVSTGTGAALAGGRPTVTLVGDLAFLYDTGGLLAARDVDADLTVVVVDNDGGGIFSFLPQAHAVAPGDFERYWGTPHGLDLAAVARAYGADTAAIEDREALEEFVAGAGKGGVRVGVIRSDRRRNVEVHDRLHSLVQEAVTGAAG